MPVYKCLKRNEAGEVMKGIGGFGVTEALVSYSRRFESYTHSSKRKHEVIDNKNTQPFNGVVTLTYPVINMYMIVLKRGHFLNRKRVIYCPDH